MVANNCIGTRTPSSAHAIFNDKATGVIQRTAVLFIQPKSDRIPLILTNRLLSFHWNNLPKTDPQDRLRQCRCESQER